MQLEATSAVRATQSNANMSSGSASTYDAFLQLFLTQLKHQDPTKPMDPTTTVTQLATFSQVEQMVQSNARLDLLLVNSALSQAASLVGKTITPADGSKAGVIKSVTIDGAQLFATLVDGRKIPITSGVSLS